MDASFLEWAIPVATVASAWGGVKVALNGTKQKVQDIHDELKHHIHDEDKQQKEIIERLTRVETKLEK